MKTAICFSGSIRDFPSCLPSLKRYLLDNLNPDIFLHLWKMDDVSSLDAKSKFKWKNDMCDERYVIDHLKPKSYVIDKYSEEWEKAIISESGVDISKFTDDKLKSYGINACGMYYKIRQCFNLVDEYCVKNNIKYDLVIRARLDFIWEDDILPSDFRKMDDNSIYLIKDRYAATGRMSNDKFFAGTFGMMKKMCNLFSYIKDYQKRGFMVEGQTLNEVHIKNLGLKVIWIGHVDTYYKCMSRHRIGNNGRIVLVNNRKKKFGRFFYEISYYLLYRNYNVIYLDRIDDINYLEILGKFKNFNVMNPDVKMNKVECLLGDTYIENFGGPQILLDYKGNQNNITSFVVDKNVYLEELMDFIVSIISTRQYGGSYYFTKTQVVNEIDLGENVVFKYLDHGYYSTTIKSYDKNTNTYRVSLNNIKAKRENIRIVNLIKYHKRLDQNTMPINPHRKKTNL
ncbi:MAG: hypothetical protein QW303_04905 [Nitrososphaerota archaeon]